MDLFNKKKLAHLQAQFDALSAKYQHRKLDELRLRDSLTNERRVVEELRGLVSMMDDELLQVAKNRYQNKYLEYTDSNDKPHVIKINNISVANGIVFLTENDDVELCHTLSHLHTIAKVTTKKAYLEYQSTHKND